MVVLITGASHTGKTALAQKLLECDHIPYLSMDHLKMGLIRSGYTSFTPEDNDSELTVYLWPVVLEMVKAAIENRQNLIVEGCYIPFDWEKDFSEEYLEQIRYVCLIFSEHYIRNYMVISIDLPILWYSGLTTRNACWNMFWRITPAICPSPEHIM